MIIFRDYFEIRKSVCSIYRIIWMKKSRKKKGCIWKRKKCCFTKTMHWLSQLWTRWQNGMNWTNSLSLLYSVDLAPSIYLYPNLKWLWGKRSASNEDVECEIDVYFEALDKLKYMKEIHILEDHWNKCISLEGKYIEEFKKKFDLKKNLFS